MVIDKPDQFSGGWGGEKLKVSIINSPDQWGEGALINIITRPVRGREPHQLGEVGVGAVVGGGES